MRRHGRARRRRPRVSGNAGRRCLRHLHRTAASRLPERHQGLLLDHRHPDCAWPVAGDPAMSERLSPLPMTTIVTTDLIGVTRGRSFPTDELDAYQVPGCGWVPANSALTPQDIIAASNPWGAYGDLRLVPDLSSRVTVNNGPDADAPALDFIHGDIRETDGRPWGACPRTLLRNEVERYRDELGLQINAAFEHEFNLDSGAAEHLAFSLEAQRQ